MATKGRRIARISNECLEAWLKGEVVQCTTVLPKDAKLVGVLRDALGSRVELSFESATWPDKTVEDICHVYPEIVLAFQGTKVADPGE